MQVSGVPASIKPTLLLRVVKSFQQHVSANAFFLQKYYHSVFMNNNNNMGLHEI
jgi:hypothetical protein